MSIQNFYFYAQDGYPLAAQFYPHQAQKRHLPVLIAPATGIVQGFYRHFATYLTTLGYDVMSFDFRGIGQSLHGKLKHSRASISDWGQYDLPAAVDTLLHLSQAKQVLLVGHSAGGQLLGVMHNFKQVAKLVTVAGSSGYLGGLKGRTQLLAPLMFYVLFPLGHTFKGFSPTQIIGMGENLPQNAGRDWAKFCSQPGYILNAKQALQADYHQQVSCPITAIFSSDDQIATPHNVKDLLELYPNAQTSMFELNPEDYQHSQIGHMLMFKKSHQNLWPILAHALLL